MPDNLPMSDVIQMVLLAENQSKSILEEAESEAEQTVTEARRKAQDIWQATRRETMEQADAMVAAAKQDAEGEKQKRLGQAADEIEAAVQLDERTAQSAIKAVVRCVCTPR